MHAHTSAHESARCNRIALLVTHSATVHSSMLTTINLSATESATYNRTPVRVELRNLALRIARARGSRFVQLVSCTGAIVDILEAR